MSVPTLKMAKDNLAKVSKQRRLTEISNISEAVETIGGLLVELDAQSGNEDAAPVLGRPQNRYGLQLALQCLARRQSDLVGELRKALNLDTSPDPQEF